MKESWYEQDGVPHERSSENVALSASCSQRKLIDWQTKTETSGDEHSDSGSDEKIFFFYQMIYTLLHTTKIHEI